jgi:hypothetical protein
MCGLFGGYWRVCGCEIGFGYVCAGDLVGLHFAFQIGDVTGGGNNGVSFCGECLDRLVLRALAFA